MHLSAELASSLTVELHRIDGLPVDLDLKVQVCSGGNSPVADRGDRLASLNGLPFADQIVVAGPELITVPELAARIGVPMGDLHGGGRPQARSSPACDLNPWVVSAGVPAETTHAVSAG